MGEHGWRAFAGVMAVLAVTHSSLADPSARDAVWAVAAWLAVAATVVGIVVHRPDRPGPWWLTAAGLSGTALAAVIAPASAELSGASARAVASDVLHTACYLMIGAAVLWFVRLQTPGGDRDSVIDGVIVAIALATVLWTVIIDPSATGAGATLSTRVTYIVAPLLPAGITAICVRLLFAAGGPGGVGPTAGRRVDPRLRRLRRVDPHAPGR